MNNASKGRCVTITPSDNPFDCSELQILCVELSVKSPANHTIVSSSGDELHALTIAASHFPHNGEMAVASEMLFIVGGPHKFPSPISQDCLRGNFLLLNPRA